MASGNKPVVRFLMPDGGTLSPNAKITWSASDADGDPLSFSVLYSADAGRTWRPLAVDVREQSITLSNLRVPGSTTGVIRIMASDGFYTSSDDSDSPLRVPTSAPIAKIMQGDGLFVPVGRTLILEGVATDIDDGPITLPSRFRWTSDKDGVLGTGQELYKRNLSRGVHLVTLEVQDGERKLGRTSIRVYVGVVPPQPTTQ
jgi:hypothetical protein